MKIKPPPHDKTRTARFIDAQKAVEGAVFCVVDEAKAAGWDPVEITNAIIAVADNKLLAIAEVADLEDLLRKLRGDG